jgi:hypothetical protein
MLDLRRREFITLVGGAAFAWPFTARAQQAAMSVVGVLSAEWPNLSGDRLRAFHDGLRESGYVERQNLAIEYRWAEGRNERLPALAAELVRRQVTVIVATSTPAVLAADGNHYDSNRVLHRSGPGSTWSGHQPQPTGRQSHGRGHLKRGGSREAAPAAARVGPHREHRCAACQPDKYRSCRDDNERGGGGGAHTGA